MHVLQYIATKADSVDEAFSIVKSGLEAQLGNDPESPTPTWFDWFVVGGGRWAKDESAQYADDYQDEVAHQSEEDFSSYLKNAKSLRWHELESLMKQVREVNLTDILDGIEETGLDYGRPVYELYPIKKLFDNTVGIWNPDSYYYDMENDSTNMVHMRNSIDNGDKDWYLVPVDFHF